MPALSSCLSWPVGNEEYNFVELFVRIAESRAMRERNASITQAERERSASRTRAERDRRIWTHSHCDVNFLYRFIICVGKGEYCTIPGVQ